MDCSTVICWTDLFVILGVSGCFYSVFDGNIIGPDQMPNDVCALFAYDTFTGFQVRMVNQPKITVMQLK